SLVSCVGRDENGQLILDYLQKEQIDTSHVTVRDGKTSNCEIVVLENGERYFPPNSYHQNVLANFEPSAADLTFVQQHDVLVSRYDISYTKVLFNRVMCELEFSGKRVADFGDWFDYDGRHPVVFPYLNQIDLAFISGDEVTVQAFLPLSIDSKAQIIVTLGEKGSVALVDGKIIEQPIIPVERIVDTTGCGDAFQAAFTVTYFQARNPNTHNLKAALQAGAQNASKTLQHFGAS
ncbi:MAG: fructoselysine 6-kinase, partial [Cellvibrionaceae bacterium]